MPTKVFKYQLETTDVQQVKMPKGAEILCIQTLGTKEKAVVCGKKGDKVTLINIMGDVAIVSNDKTKEKFSVHQDDLL